MDFKVTVVTVVRNGEKVIGRLFDSIRKFKTAEVEFIVLDGLSTDDTLKLIGQNSDIIDNWLSEQDEGIYDAMNKAVDMARGRWLIFMGADDELLEGFSMMLPELQENNTIYYGKVFFHDTLITGPVKSDYKLTKSNICHQAIFYPAAVFNKYRYQLRYIKCADYALNLDLWGDDEFKFEYRDYLIANFPEGGFSSGTVDTLFENDKEALIKRNLNRAAYYHYIKKNYGVVAMLKRMLFNK